MRRIEFNDKRGRAWRFLRGNPHSTFYSSFYVATPGKGE